MSTKNPNEPLNCPHCGVSLLGDPISEDIAKHYSGTHWKREIGHYSMELDRTIGFMCPDCRGTWGTDHELTTAVKAKMKMKKGQT